MLIATNLVEPYHYGYDARQDGLVPTQCWRLLDTDTADVSDEIMDSGLICDDMDDLVNQLKAMHPAPRGMTRIVTDRQVANVLDTSVLDPSLEWTHSLLRNFVVENTSVYVQADTLVNLGEYCDDIQEVSDYRCVLAPDLLFSRQSVNLPWEITCNAKSVSRSLQALAKREQRKNGTGYQSITKKGYMNMRDAMHGILCEYSQCVWKTFLRDTPVGQLDWSQDATWMALRILSCHKLAKVVGAVGAMRKRIRKYVWALVKYHGKRLATYDKPSYHRYRVYDFRLWLYEEARKMGYKLDDDVYAVRTEAPGSSQDKAE
jgi:hypothetical protein